MKRLCIIFAVTLVSLMWVSCTLSQDEDETGTVTVSNDSSVPITRITLRNTSSFGIGGQPPNEVDDDEPLAAGKSRSFKILAKSNLSMGSWVLTVYADGRTLTENFSELENKGKIDFSFNGSNLLKQP